MLVLGPDVAGAIVFLAIAVLFLALVILFKREMRVFLGFAIGALALMWITVGLLWWTSLLALAIAAGVTAVVQMKDRQRRQEITRPGMTEVDRRLAELEYDREHGVLSDEEYAERRAVLMGATVRQEA
jgi:membrane protein implicated in regulation of membrane protease activity